MEEADQNLIREQASNLNTASSHRNGFLAYYCAVQGCSNRKAKRKRNASPTKLSFHRFPKDPKRCVTWARWCENRYFKTFTSDRDLQLELQKKDYLICEEHFSYHCYTTNGDNQRKRLKSNAFPNINGPAVIDSSGEVISPIRPCWNRTKGRLVGLIPIPESDSDDSDSDQYEDLDIILSRKESEFFCPLDKKTGKFQQNGSKSHSDEETELETPTLQSDASLEDGSGEDGPAIEQNGKPSVEVLDSLINPSLQPDASLEDGAEEDGPMEELDEESSADESDFLEDEVTENDLLAPSAEEAGPEDKLREALKNKKSRLDPAAKIRAPKTKGCGETGLIGDLLNKKSKYKRLPEDVEGLKKEIYKGRSNYRRLKVAYQQLKNGQITNKSAKEVAIQFIEDSFPAVTSEFLTSILKNSEKLPRGRRYSRKAKVIFLSIYIFDPRAYNNLRGILKSIPCPSVLKKMMALNPVEEGYMPFVMKALKITVQSFPAVSKFVAFCFDGINLKKEFNFVEKGNDPEMGYMEGLYEDGSPVSEAIVISIRSIHGDFKTPIAYFLCNGRLTADHLRKKVDEGIENVNGTGLLVKAIVCDQLGVHQRMFREHFQVSLEEPYYVYKKGLEGEYKIYCLFDPPHMLKSIKANLKHHDAVIDGKRASWQHIVDFYVRDNSRTTRMAPKLTDDHIYGKNMTAMSVPKAAQILSRTVSGGILECVDQDREKKPEDRVFTDEHLTTAKLCEMMNDLFDSTNSTLKRSERQLKAGEFPTSGISDFVPPDIRFKNHPKPKSRRPFLEPLSPKSLHFKLWEQADKYISTIHFVHRNKKGELIRNKDGTVATKRPPCLYNWRLTLRALKALWTEFHEELGFNELPTNTLNQDFLENFFSQVRYRNNSPDVSPKQFRINFGYLLFDHLMDPSRGRNTNCSADDGLYLFLLDEELFSTMGTLVADESVSPDLSSTEASTSETSCAESSMPDTSSSTESSTLDQVVVQDPTVQTPEEIEEIPIETAEDYNDRENPGDIKYASYLARRLVQKSQRCGDCIKLYTDGDRSRIMDHTEDKRSTYQGINCVRDLQLLVHNAVLKFNEAFEKGQGSKNLGKLLGEAVRKTPRFDLLSRCSLHGESHPDFFVKVVLRSMIRFTIKLKNNKMNKDLKEARQKAKLAALMASSKATNARNSLNSSLPLTKELQNLPPATAKGPKTKKQKSLFTEKVNIKSSGKENENDTAVSLADEGIHVLETSAAEESFFKKPAPVQMLNSSHRTTIISSTPRKRALSDSGLDVAETLTLNLSGSDSFLCSPISNLNCESSTEKNKHPVRAGFPKQGDQRVVQPERNDMSTCSQTMLPKRVFLVHPSSESVGPRPVFVNSTSVLKTELSNRDRNPPAVIMQGKFSAPSSQVINGARLVLPSHLCSQSDERKDLRNGSYHNKFADRSLSITPGKLLPSANIVRNRTVSLPSELAQTSAVSMIPPLPTLLQPRNITKISSSSINPDKTAPCLSSSTNLGANGGSHSASRQQSNLIGLNLAVGAELSLPVRMPDGQVIMKRVVKKTDGRLVVAGTLAAGLGSMTSNPLSKMSTVISGNPIQRGTAQALVSSSIVNKTEPAIKVVIQK